jgi:hypothetical protein
MARQSDNVSAVLEPTGPPMPTLRGCVLIDFSNVENLKSVHRGAFTAEDAEDAEEKQKQYKTETENLASSARNLIYLVTTIASSCQKLRLRISSVACGQPRAENLLFPVWVTTSSPSYLS